MKAFALLGGGWLAAALVSPAPGQDGEAEKLFRGMEKKVLAAKAFEVTFAWRVGKEETRGELLVTRGNQARLKVVGPLGGQRRAGFELVSDGRLVRTKGAKLYVRAPSGLPAVDVGGQSQWRTPKRFHAGLGTAASRGGVWFTVLAMPYLCEGSWDGNADGRGSRMKVHDFRLRGTERVGAREARVVLYRFGGGDRRADEEVTLWLDAETLLPLQRSLTLQSEGARVTETYRGFVLNPKVGATAFALPEAEPAPSEERVTPVDR
jgi:outer membrane lipoprotein-sorting protein